MTDVDPRTCALPGCHLRIEADPDQPGRKYCSPAHRAAARRHRAETSADRLPWGERAPRRPPEHGGGVATLPLRTVNADSVPEMVDLQAGSLAHDRIVRARPPTPTQGWRHLVHRASGGLLNPGPGRREREHAALIERVRRERTEPHHVAVASIKGGVGKTTVAACLGLTLAELRGDRVLALDASPNAGTLAERLTGEPVRTVRQLIDDAERIKSFSDASGYTSLAGRLQVLASDQDPANAAPFGETEYQVTDDVLTRFFDIVVTDSGTGLMHSAMEGTLAVADTLVVVGAPTVDGASRASKTLDWLTAHGYADLVSRSVMVLSCDRTSRDIDGAQIREHFSERCRSVHDIPHDPHLATGGRIDLDALRGPTRMAFLNLAADIADGFGG